MVLKWLVFSFIEPKETSLQILCGVLLFIQSVNWFRFYGLNANGFKLRKFETVKMV
jgi:hypothetical protein